MIVSLARQSVSARLCTLDATRNFSPIDSVYTQLSVQARKFEFRMHIVRWLQNMKMHARTLLM